MTAPNREILANHYSTTLNGAISNSDTSIVVTDGSGFPSTGNFRLICEEELLLCTARSGNTLTVTRGVESTGAAAHSSSTTIETIFTAGGMDQYGLDNIPCWGVSPPYGKIVADDGATVLTASSFTWDNQETSTVSDQGGTILLTTATTAGLDNRVLYRSAPSTPYAYVGAFQFCSPRGGSNDGEFLLMGFREAATSDLELIAVGSNVDRTLQFTCERWTDATTFSATIRGIDMLLLVGNTIWIKIEDDGTDLVYYVGMDGVNWIEVERNSRTAFFTSGPDQVWWGGRNDTNSTNTGLVRLLHWSRES